MQFTTLNKLVRLFLLGSSAALFLVPSLVRSVGTLSSLGLDKEGFAIPLGLIFLGLITALGCVVEGLSDCTLQKLVRRVAISPSAARWFIKNDQALRVSRWQATFLKALADATWFPSADLPTDREKKSIAAAIFHKTAPVDHVRYVDAHYGTFLLSSGLAVLFAGPGILSLVILLPSSVPALTSIALVLGCVGCSYALCVLALDNYLYTWEATFRYGSLWLWEKRDGASTSGAARSCAQPLTAADAPGGAPLSS